MGGLPWIKVRVDLARDPRALHLDDLLGEPRAWTYLLQLRLYLAEHAAEGRVTGPGAVATVERAAGWTGRRGALVDALRDAGFVRAGPARDGGGTEIEDLDWASEQGAHVAKFQRDATKPRGNRVNVVSPSRDIGGTRAGPASTPRGKSRELRVESREEASASQGPLVPEPEPSGNPGEFALTSPKAEKPARKPSAAEQLYAAMQQLREERCAEVGEPWIQESWPAARQNKALGAIAKAPPEAQERFEAAYGLYLADDGQRVREPAWSLAFFLTSGVRERYETRAMRGNVG